MMDKCLECKHYVAHYMYSKYGFNKINNCGHCMKVKKYLKYLKQCDLFEKSADKKEKATQELFTTLTRLEYNLGCYKKVILNVKEQVKNLQKLK